VLNAFPSFWGLLYATKIRFDAKNNMTDLVKCQGLRMLRAFFMPLPAQVSHSQYLGHGMEEQLEKDIAKFQSFEIVAT
jgi:hypothetical protein